jgi:hypothetical protein
VNTTALPLSKTSPGFSVAKLIVGVVAAIFAVVLCLFIYIPNCVVHGYEFNPKTWQVRHFSFWADPFTNIQFTGISHDTSKIAIDSSILSSLNTAATIDADRWDLVELRDYHPNPSLGPAAILVDNLTTRKYGWSARPIQFWTNWTNNNPKKAPAFWQAVQTLTIHQAYHAIPDLLDLAFVLDDQYAASLSDTMSRALLDQAQTFQARGELLAASATAKAGLKYDAANPELNKLAETR